MSHDPRVRLARRDNLIEKMWQLSTIARSQAVCRDLDVRRLEKLVSFLDEWTLANDVPQRTSTPRRKPIGSNRQQS